MTATVCPFQSYPSGQLAVWRSWPAKSWRPGISGHFQCWQSAFLTAAMKNRTDASEATHTT